MLARRPYSVAELRRALEKKFGTTAEVRSAVARLRELGYLNDRKFAEHAASTLARNKAFGRFRVRRELKSRLVDYKVIEPALRAVYEETDERELLEIALDRKLRSVKLPVTERKLHSICQSLLRRGFRAGDIMKAVRARPELRPVAEDVELAEPESGARQAE